MVYPKALENIDREKALREAWSVNVTLNPTDYSAHLEQTVDEWVAATVELKAWASDEVRRLVETSERQHRYWIAAAVDELRREADTADGRLAVAVRRELQHWARPDDASKEG